MEMQKTLSEDEKIILRNINGWYRYIARDKDGLLYLYKIKPKKGFAVWHSAGWTWIVVDDHLFQMVQWNDKKPTLIVDLLKEK